MYVAGTVCLTGHLFSSGIYPEQEDLMPWAKLSLSPSFDPEQNSPSPAPLLFDESHLFTIESNKTPELEEELTKTPYDFPPLLFIPPNTEIFPPAGIFFPTTKPETTFSNYPALHIAESTNMHLPHNGLVLTREQTIFFIHYFLNNPPAFNFCLGRLCHLKDHAFNNYKTFQTHISHNPLCSIKCENSKILLSSSSLDSIDRSKIKHQEVQLALYKYCTQTPYQRTISQKKFKHDRECPGQAFCTNALACAYWVRFHKQFPHATQRMLEQ